jgi:hypothetical protein
LFWVVLHRLGATVVYWLMSWKGPL